MTTVARSRVVQVLVLSISALLRSVKSILKLPALAGRPQLQSLRPMLSLAAQAAPQVPARQVPARQAALPAPAAVLVVPVTV